MRVAEARGIIVYEASRRSVPVYEYSPMEIKAAVSGDGTADKARMAKMISLLVKLPGKTGILDDEYDAVAVALTHAAIIHSRRLLQK
jgi:crossover junction endodeoxyribonuclease RuvC